MVGLGHSPLRHGPSDSRSTINLFTFIAEPSGLFRSFCTYLAREFYASGLAKEVPVAREREGLEFCQAKIIDSRGLRSGIPNNKPTLKHLGRDITPRFNARNLCDKFGDVVWAKDVHLDRVCISEITPDDVFEDGQVIGVKYRDIVSIPLPGVTWEPRPFECMRIPYQWPTAERQGMDRA